MLANRSRRFSPCLSGRALEGRIAPSGVVQQVGVVLNLYAGTGESDFVVDYSDDGSQLTVINDGVTRTFDASSVLLIKFYGSPDGDDSFINDTDKTSFSYVSNADTFVQGGTGLDIFNDFSGGATFVDAG